MSLAVFLPLLLSLGICLVPVWLLRTAEPASAQDYFVSPGYTPPEAIRNSSIANALRLAVFGPFFAFGASGDFWPVIIGAVCLGSGIYLVFLLRPIHFHPQRAGGRSIHHRPRFHRPRSTATIRVCACSRQA